MAKRGKNINVFLMDGDASGRIKCTLSNWTGIAYKIPRTDLDHCKERADLKQSGVYLLFGTSDETGKNVVYIGQAGARKNGEGLLYRLREHRRNPDKDYWTEAIAFTTSNNSLGPTEISYLENRFCNLAIEANRYEVKNGNDPTPGNLTEEKESEMEEFIDFARLIVGTLGHKVFEPIGRTPQAESSGQQDSSSPVILHFEREIRSFGKVSASGFQTSEGFVVLQDSQIASYDANSVLKSFPEKLTTLRQTAKITPDGILQENLLFSSPSYAAMFVSGKSQNGQDVWRTDTGIPLKSLEKQASEDPL